MLRGLVMFTKAQIEELALVVKNDRLKDTSVYIKIMSAIKQDLPQIPVQFSEEEIEMLTDEMEPDPNNEVRKILSTTLLSWKSSDQ